MDRELDLTDSGILQVVILMFLLGSVCLIAKTVYWVRSLMNIVDR